MRWVQGTLTAQKVPVASPSNFYWNKRKRERAGGAHSSKNRKLEYVNSVLNQ